MASRPKNALQIVLLVLATLAFTFGTACLQAFEIMGPSTEPGLLNGDRVITLRHLPFLGMSLEAGDMVIARSPLDGAMIAKRVVGMPGDVFEMRDDKVYINGELVPTSEAGKCTVGIGAQNARCRVSNVTLGGRRYQTSIAHPVPDSGPVEVPEGSYFILGDHLDSSNDSRNPGMGPVPLEAIHSVILSVYWSSDHDGIRWGRMFQSVQ